MAVLDIDSEDFPGIYAIGKAFSGPRPDVKTHPHLRLDKTMTSVPKVAPGDMVIWHCVRSRFVPDQHRVLNKNFQDMIHAVEVEHTGTEDSCGASPSPSHFPYMLLTFWELSDVHPRRALYPYERGVHRAAARELLARCRPA